MGVFWRRRLESGGEVSESESESGLREGGGRLWEDIGGAWDMGEGGVGVGAKSEARVPVAVGAVCEEVRMEPIKEGVERGS